MLFMWVFMGYTIFGGLAVGLFLLLIIEIIRRKHTTHILQLSL